MSIIENIVDVFVVFGGTIGYIFQYRDIAKSKDASGFSPFVCLILLAANILRCVYRFGKYFETSLVLQSVVMIGCQLALLELCVRTKRASDKTIRKDWVKDFWNWSSFTQYVQFLSALAVGSLVFARMFNTWFIWELVGSVAMTIEAALAMPQVLANYRRKSTAGCSIELIISWFLGDIVKTFLFWLKAAPAQFLLCGIAQLALDFVVVGQIFKYKGNKGSVVDTSDKKHIL